ncbi:hypothetical protein GCM10010376_61210 [Streptomyces violaceusniger]
MVLFLADRVLLWMEGWGWVYWRKQKGLSSIGFDFAQGITPGAQAGKRGMEQERVRKNVRPAFALEPYASAGRSGCSGC